VRPEATPTRTMQGPAHGLKRLSREPLLQFLALGLVIFAVAQWRDAERERRRIDVGPAVIQKLAATYQAQFGGPPDPAKLRALRDAYVRQEIYYREGVALGLDQGDEIVRRRVAQKYAFLSEDVGARASPSEAALQTYFQAHAQRYVEPARTAFRQVYFSDDGGSAPARAAAALPTLRAGAPVRGDDFPGPQSTGLMAPDEIERLFGASEFSRTVATLPVGVWSGPYRSGYGWHLVRVDAREPARTPDFAQAREAVLDDYRQAAGAAANAERYRRLLARYRLVGDGSAR